MCTCIKEIQEKALQLKYKESAIVRADFISAAFIIEKPGVRLKATGEMELIVEGRKKPIVQQIVYTYCPFCGEKY
jgi:hypothetical protein